jgi:hypothetical protein
MKNVRAILIDTIQSEVREVVLDGHNRELNELLGCDCFCAATVDIPPGNMLFVDDSGLFHRRKGAFRFPCKPGYHTLDGEPYQTRSGNGIIVGYDDEGDDCHTTVSVEEARSKVKFVSPEDLPDPKFEFYPVS